jgi:hypothetical protein
LDVAFDLYEHTLKIQQTAEQSFRGLLLQEVVGMRRWNMLSSILKLCSLSQACGKSPQLHLARLEQEIAMSPFLPASLFCAYMVNKSAASVDIDIKQKVFSVRALSAAFDLEAMERLLIDLLSELKRDARSPNELLKATVFHLGGVCRAARALKSQAFSIATEMTSSISNAPLSIAAAVESLGCATKNRPSLITPRDIFGLCISAPTSSATAGATAPQAEQVVTAFLKLSNMARSAVPMPNTRAAELQHFRAIIHDFLIQNSPTYVNSCWKPQSSLTMMPSDKAIIVAWLDNHDKLDGHILRVDKDPNHGNFMQFTISRKEIQSVHQDARLLVQTLYTDAATTPEQMLSFAKVLEKARALLSVMSHKEEPVCTYKHTRLFIVIFLIAFLLQFKAHPTQLSKDVMVVVLDAVRLFFDTSYPAYAVQGDNADLIRQFLL